MRQHRARHASAEANNVGRGAVPTVDVALCPSDAGGGWLEVVGGSSKMHYHNIILYKTFIPIYIYIYIHTHTHNYFL